VKPIVLWGLTKESFSEWSHDKVPQLAAALAFYTLFAIAPLLVISIAVAGMIFGEEAARGEGTVPSRLRKLCRVDVEVY
jgi:membrane protein